MGWSRHAHCLILFFAFPLPTGLCQLPRKGTWTTMAIAWWASHTLLNTSYKMDLLIKALLGKKYFYCFHSLSSTILGHLISWHLLSNHKSYFKRVRNSMGILALPLDILICLQRTFCFWNMHGMEVQVNHVCVDFSVITQHFAVINYSFPKWCSKEIQCSILKYSKEDRCYINSRFGIN